MIEKYVDPEDNSVTIDIYKLRFRFIFGSMQSIGFRINYWHQGDKNLALEFVRWYAFISIIKQSEIDHMNYVKEQIAKGEFK